MDKKTLKDIDVKGKKVYVRVDYNVPFDENQNITNDTRMVRTLPTINYLLDNGAAVILAKWHDRYPVSCPSQNRCPDLYWLSSYCEERLSGR